MAVDMNSPCSVGFSDTLIDIFEIMEDEKLIDPRQQGRPVKDHKAI